MIVHCEFNSSTVLTELAFHVLVTVTICLSKTERMKNQGNYSSEKEIWVFS